MTIFKDFDITPPGLILSGAKQVGRFNSINEFGTSNILDVFDIKLVNYCIDFKNNKTKFPVHLLFAETVNDFEGCEWVHADDWVPITNIEHNFKQRILSFEDDEMSVGHPFTIINCATFERKL